MAVETVQWCSGWTARLGNPERLSRIHLREAGGELTLCGRVVQPKPALRWRPSEGEVEREGVCLRCAAERAQREEHVPTFSSHRTGVGNRYGRGASGSGGRNTHVCCSCGWSNTANVRKRDQEVNFRDHVRQVVAEGLWRVEVERYEPRIESSAVLVASRLGVDVERIEALPVGGRFTVSRSAGKLDAKAAIRLAMPAARRA